MAAIPNAARPRVLAIVLDAPNQPLLESWMDAGLLPNLQRHRKASTALPMDSIKQYSNEHCWIPMLTGLRRDRWNHWLDHWDPAAYRYSEASIHDWLQAPVFYALGDRRRVVTFDLTAPVAPGVEGAQVVGWAIELNESYPQSQPPELMERLTARHGHDPKLVPKSNVTNALSGRDGYSYVIPSLYDTEAMLEYADVQVRSVQRRNAACLDLLREEQWDLFLVQYAEVHTAGHLMWHLSQPHPLNVLKPQGRDPVLDVYRAVDDSIGSLIAAAGDPDYVVVLTLDAIVVDCLESCRTAVLPELLYRWNFPGHAALAVGESGTAVPPPQLGYRRHWKHEVWDLRTEEGESVLESPSTQEARGDPMSWCPANWYAPAWPRMRAFALPSVADGYIRLNVAGRESHGLVDPAAFVATCDEVTAQLMEVIDSRTGCSLVRRVVRLRDDPFDADPKKPPADLIVIFQDEVPVDTAESPRLGRVGPLPYFRTGSHHAHDVTLSNVLYARGPGLEPGRELPVAGLEDIGASLLELLGEQPPAGTDGRARLR